MTRSIVTTAYVLLLAGNAQAAIVTFDDMPLSGCVGLNTSCMPATVQYAVQTPQSFEFGLFNNPPGYPAPYDISVVDGYYDNSTHVIMATSFAYYAPQAEIDMRSADGSLFSMQSLDIYESSDPNMGHAYISAWDASGQLIVSMYGPYSPGSGGWQSISFDASWTGIKYLRITAGIGCCVVGESYSEALALDNFNATVVPLPTAVWLFASGLGLLGWLRRRPSENK